MTTSANDRQSSFVRLAATHAEDFKTRVAQHDRENSFAFENIQALKASGYVNMTLPAEFGGGAANLTDFLMAQERLAQGDGPTAVAINMHIFNVAVRSDLWRLGDERQRPFLEASARDSLILCSGTSDPRMNTVVGFAGLNDTTRRAEKVNGGYLVNGRAGFGTLCVCADFFEQTAHYDDPVKGPQCVFFTVPAKTTGIKIQNNWDTMSIRSSSSHDTVWENVFVPDENVTLRPARTWETYNNVFCSWFMTSVSACYLGIAQAAHDHAISWARDVLCSRDAGIVAENRHRAESRFGLVRHPRIGHAIAHIEDEGLDRGGFREFGFRRGKCGLIDIHQRQLDAGPRERSRNTEPNSARASGNERDFPINPIHVFSAPRGDLAGIGISEAARIYIDAFSETNLPLRLAMNVRSILTCVRFGWGSLPNRFHKSQDRY